MFDVTTALFLDVCTVVLCALLLLRYGRLAYTHPATIYLVFHLFVVTWRLLQLEFGAATLFSDMGPLYEPVTRNEIARAAMVADGALLVMTCGWIRASRFDRRRYGSLPRTGGRRRTLQRGHVLAIAAVTLVAGLLSWAAIAAVPGLGGDRVAFLGEWQTSAWLIVATAWPGCALLALMYWYGFRWWLLAPMAGNLFLMSYQGYSRFRIVIPIILMTQIYLDRRGYRWPSARLVASLFAVAVLFFPLKEIGRGAQVGASPIEVVQEASSSLGNVLTGKTADDQLLDMFASSLTLVDQKGKFYYGSMYLPLVTLPIPRQWWPEKPSIADYLKDMSTPERPMAEIGAAVSILGEAYANLGYLGVLLVSYLSAYWLARAYFRAYRHHYLSVSRFEYLLVASCLIQVYRDGLTSLFMFPVVYLMPLAMVVLLHWLSPMRRLSAESTASKGGRCDLLVPFPSAAPLADT